MKISPELYKRGKALMVKKGTIPTIRELQTELGITFWTARKLRDALEHETILTQESNVKEYDIGKGEILRVAVCADVHVGSRYAKLGEFLSYLKYVDEASDVLFIAGDLLDGIGVYKGQEMELALVRVEEQVERAKELLSYYKKPIFFITGNHEYSVTERTGIEIGNLLASKTATFLGPHKGEIIINGIRFQLWHGSGAGSYAVSYKLQKTVEHFLPGKKPRFLFAGHWHQAAYLPLYRNVDAYLCGTFQGETILTRRLGVLPQLGGWIITIRHEGGEVKGVSSEFIPFYEIEKAEIGPPVVLLEGVGGIRK
ncbi:MAG: metallophosphoesterase [Nitrososphaeria archaeon]